MSTEKTPIILKIRLSKEYLPIMPMNQKTESTIENKKGIIISLLSVI